MLLMVKKTVYHAKSPYGSFITRIGLSLVGALLPGQTSSDASFLKNNLRRCQYQGFGCGLITSGGGLKTGLGISRGVTLGVGKGGLGPTGGLQEGDGRNVIGGLEKRRPCNPYGSMSLTGLFEV